MSALDERNLGHVRAIAQERGPKLQEPPSTYERIVLDFLETIKRYNLCLETTENAEAFAAKVREYLLTGPDAEMFAQVQAATQAG